jgi:hypothetical protein
MPAELLRQVTMKQTDKHDEELSVSDFSDVPKDTKKDQLLSVQHRKCLQHRDSLATFS